MPCAAAGPRVAAMASIDSITLEVGDPTLIDAALAAGATEIKPAAESLPASSHASVWGDTQTVGQGASW